MTNTVNFPSTVTNRLCRRAGIFRKHRNTHLYVRSVATCFLEKLVLNSKIHGRKRLQSEHVLSALSDMGIGVGIPAVVPTHAKEQEEQEEQEEQNDLLRPITSETRRKNTREFFDYIIKSFKSHLQQTMRAYVTGVLDLKLRYVPKTNSCAIVSNRLTVKYDGTLPVHQVAANIAQECIKHFRSKTTRNAQQPDEIHERCATYMIHSCDDVIDRDTEEIYIKFYNGAQNAVDLRTKYSKALERIKEANYGMWQYIRQNLLVLDLTLLAPAGIDELISTKQDTGKSLLYQDTAYLSAAIEDLDDVVYYLVLETVNHFLTGNHPEYKNQFYRASDSPDDNLLKRYASIIAFCTGVIVGQFPCLLESAATFLEEHHDDDNYGYVDTDELVRYCETVSLMRPLKK